MIDPRSLRAGDHTLSMLGTKGKVLRIDGDNIWIQYPDRSTEMLDLAEHSYYFSRMTVTGSDPKNPHDLDFVE